MTCPDCSRPLYPEEIDAGRCEACLETLARADWIDDPPDSRWDDSWVADANREQASERIGGP